MGAITLLYVLLIVGGVVWIVYRVTAYTRTERERESRWALMASDRLMTRPLDTAKKEKTSTGPVEFEQPKGSRLPRPVARKGSYTEGRCTDVATSHQRPKKAR